MAITKILARKGRPDVDINCVLNGDKPEERNAGYPHLRLHEYILRNHSLHIFGIYKIAATSFSSGIERIAPFRVVTK